jgi:uncharacterized membrane protein
MNQGAHKLSKQERKSIQAHHHRRQHLKSALISFCIVPVILMIIAFAPGFGAITQFILAMIPLIVFGCWRLRKMVGQR